MYRFEVYVRSVTVKSSNLPFWEDADAGSARRLLSGAVAVKLMQYPLLTLLPATLTGKQVKGCKPVCSETTFSLHSGKSCTFTADRESLCDKLAQAPLCLLFLGPSAKGRPGLTGVATLQLGLENADPHPNPSSNDSCCRRVQPLPLISPAGIEIGSITAAARIFCCMPTASRTQLIAQRNASCNDSAVSDAGCRVISSEHSKPASDKDEQAERSAATPLASAKAAAADVSKVSAAVQTDTPQPEMHTETPIDTDSGRRVHQASVGVQAEEQGVPSQQAALQEPQASAALVLQSPHFHLYPPPPPAAPPPPPPLQAAPQEAAQAAAVINISQPSFHLHPRMSCHAVSTHTDAEPAQKQGSVATGAESETVLAAGEPESVSPAAERGAVQQAAEHHSTLQLAAAASTEAGASDDFDSWCPVTAVPYPSACTAPVTGGDRLSAGMVSGGLTKGVPHSQQSQVCSGAHVALQRQPLHCRHCEGLGHPRPRSPAKHHIRPMSRLRQSRAVSHCQQMLRMATAGLDSYCPACLLPCATPVAAPAAPLHHPSRSNHLHSWDPQQPAAEQHVYVHRHFSNAEGDNLTGSEGSKSGKTGRVGGSNRDVVVGGSGRDVTAAGSDDREVIATQQQASDAQQHLLALSASAEAGNVSEANSEQLLAWGRAGLSKATMLMRLQEALADVEQLKADLLNSEDSARQPGQPTTAPKKKRKAQSLIQHPALSHGPGRSSKLKAHVALTQGHGDSAGDALTQDKSSSTVLVHQPASRGESQAELDVDLSTRPEEHRAVPGSQIVSHKVQIRAVPSSPNVSQKRQMQPRRQQGPLPGSPIAILACQQKLTAHARRQSHMSQCNSSVADPVVGHSNYTNQRWDSKQAAQQLPDVSTAALDTLQQDDKHSDCEGIFPADKAAVTYTTAAPSDGDSATAKLADPGVADSASADLAEPAHQLAAYHVQTSDAGGYMFMSREDQKIDETSSVADQGPEADMASEDVPQTKAEAAGLPSIRAVIRDAAASVAEASQAAGFCHSVSTASSASQHQEGKQGGRADVELGSRKHSMQPPNDVPQKLTASVPSSTSAGVAMQYPWMDPSDQQGSRDLPPLAEEAPGIHVTFATNVLPSAKHQGHKIPLRYLAAAAADKASVPSPAPTKEEAWVVRSAPEQPPVALKPEAEQGQSQHRSLAEHTGTAATAGTFQSHGSTEGSKPLHWQHQQQQQPSQEYSSPMGGAATNQGDGSMHGNSDNGETNERADAVSVASFANSAASGLGHLMRAQQPWSESESSSSPDRTSATGSADGKDFSQLQAEVMSQPDTEQQLPQQPPLHVVNQLDSLEQAQQQLLLSEPEVSAEAGKEELPSAQQPAQQDQYVQPVHVTTTTSSSSRPSWALEHQAVQPMHDSSGSRPSWALEQQAVQPMHDSSGNRPSWALEQQAVQPMHDSSGSRPGWALEQQSAHEQPVHASSSSSSSRPSWALEQVVQPVHESSSNGRPCWVHDQQAAYAPPVIDSSSRTSWAVDELSGASQPWDHPISVVEDEKEGDLVSQQRLQALTGVSQPVLVRVQEGVKLENAASEVSEEAYSDVFEEDMPQPAADDDVSDAASVRSTSMSVHSPSDTLEQCVGKYTSPYTGAAMKMQMFTSTPNIQKSIKPGSIRNDGIRQ